MAIYGRPLFFPRPLIRTCTLLTTARYIYTLHSILLYKNINGTAALLIPVLGIRIRRIRMFLGLPDPDPDPLVRGANPAPDPDPDPSLFS
jgi:hypothetical protein